MSAVYCDTSAIYALLDPTDRAHRRVTNAWSDLLDSSSHLLTTSYVAVETMTLVQSRRGMKAAARVRDIFAEFIEVHAIPLSLHERSVEDLFRLDRRALSLVDCTSFNFMRHARIARAFAVDAHFKESGFTLLPD